MGIWGKVQGTIEVNYKVQNSHIGTNFQELLLPDSSEIKDVLEKVMKKHWILYMFGDSKKDLKEALAEYYSGFELMPGQQFFGCDNHFIYNVIELPYYSLETAIINPELTKTDELGSSEYYFIEDHDVMNDLSVNVGMGYTPLGHSDYIPINKRVRVHRTTCFHIYINILDRHFSSECITRIIENIISELKSLKFNAKFVGFTSNGGLDVNPQGVYMTGHDPIEIDLEDESIDTDTYDGAFKCLEDDNINVFYGLFTKDQIKESLEITKNEDGYDYYGSYRLLKHIQYVMQTKQLNFNQARDFVIEFMKGEEGEKNE